MAGYTKISDPPAVVGGRRRGMRNAWKATVLAAALVVGGSIEALAQDPPDPSKDNVWGGCVLGAGTVPDGPDPDALPDPSDTVNRLIADIKEGLNIVDAGVTVSFVVVYTNANNNNGQPLPSGNFTGPIVCTNPAEVDITAFDKDGPPLPANRLRETTDIPGETHPAGVAAEDINIKSAEEVFVLQYQVNGGDLDGTTENRVCHTTDANVDCFRIFEPLD